ncbi:MAG: dTDP-4-dehydrorhamnose 3,5-epimerase [Elusimicrobiota bacterium]|jgi:dTDP-4-dehydrorhamnose 3,5-epimerase|nr:dTDP-4-dehydrorhamnose 3,5-epimerase [Elusimicrobiota bacterium]
MKITELAIKGAFLIEREEFKDERGSMSVSYNKKELAEIGIDFEISQCNVSKNYKAGVLRGLHYQKEPFSEIKFVSCIRGAIFDVAVDFREDSPTYLKYQGFELTESNNKALYIPKGCLHGFQTLIDNTIVTYFNSQFYTPSHYAGVRWNDPKINIEWPPCENRTINERDRNYPLL